MPDQTAEEAAHEYSQAVIAGDIGTSLRKMTSDAFGQMMDIGNDTWDFAGYEIEDAGLEGATHVFNVTYRSREGDLRLRQRYQQIDGVWLLVDLDRID